MSMRGGEGGGGGVFGGHYGIEDRCLVTTLVYSSWMKITKASRSFIRHQPLCVDVLFIFLISHVACDCISPSCVFLCSPGLERKFVGRACDLFSREHDVIERGQNFLEQKGSVLHTVHSYSLFFASKICEVSHPLPLLFFTVLYTTAQLRSFYPWRCSSEKNTSLSLRAQLQCLQSRAGEPVNEANVKPNLFEGG